MNNKGFTLVELLGVIVILVLILSIAVPNIASTFERNKYKIDEEKRSVIISAAEIYASLHKEEFDYDSFLNGDCGITVSLLKESKLITTDELKGSNGNVLVSDGIKVYFKGDGVYALDTQNSKSTCSTR